MNYTDEGPKAISFNKERLNHKLQLFRLRYLIFAGCLFRVNLVWGAHKSSARLLNRYMMNKAVYD